MTFHQPSSKESKRLLYSEILHITNDTHSNLPCNQLLEWCMAHLQNLLYCNSWWWTSSLVEPRWPDEGYVELRCPRFLLLLWSYRFLDPSLYSNLGWTLEFNQWNLLWANLSWFKSSWCPNYHGRLRKSSCSIHIVRYRPWLNNHPCLSTKKNHKSTLSPSLRLSFEWDYLQNYLN